MEKHLKVRLGELFQLEYDLLLYDITSTYFEGTYERNDQAQFGYSRDKRSDCTPFQGKEVLDWWLVERGCRWDTSWSF
ncbi:MAG: hypothetical protein Q7O66_05150 [Dehalococcoidia bacterium]|nr:hypothetical protein [Dehalococcoidia bacterium]